MGPFSSNILTLFHPNLLNPFDNLICIILIIPKHTDLLNKHFIKSISVLLQPDPTILLILFHIIGHFIPQHVKINPIYLFLLVHPLQLYLYPMLSITTSFISCAHFFHYFLDIVPSSYQLIHPTTPVS